MEQTTLALASEAADGSTCFPLEAALRTIAETGRVEAVIGLEEVSVCGSGGPVPIPVLDLRQWLPDASPVDWHALAQDVRPTHPETADNLDRIPVVRDEPILRGDAVTLMLSDVIEQVQRGAPGSPSATVSRVGDRWILSNSPVPVLLQQVSLSPGACPELASLPWDGEVAHMCLIGQLDGVMVRAPGLVSPPMNAHGSPPAVHPEAQSFAQAYAQALGRASDHLVVRVDPTTPPTVKFEWVRSRTLEHAGPAVIPASELDVRVGSGR
ncbi:MAG: hypothetical protein KC621_13455 [Myxococcales bacterium]|nr:hypothetical protein [Myxococcales bacterium]